MLYLSKAELEIIGNDILADFSETPLSGFTPIAVEKLAKDYLGLDWRYMKLSDEGNLLGITTFSGIELELNRDGRTDRIIVPQDTVLLEESMLDDKTSGRRRFTLAHECAHHILNRYEEAKFGHSRLDTFVAGRTYSCRDLNQVTNWEEWQANTLGSILLMPTSVILHAVFMFCGIEKLMVYGFDNRLLHRDYVRVSSLCEYLGVSVAAFIIRAKGLDLAESRPWREYREPLDIWCDEGEFDGTERAKGVVRRSVTAYQKT